MFTLLPPSRSADPAPHATDSDIKALRQQAVETTDNVSCVLSHIKRNMGSDAAKDLGKALGLKEDFEDLDQSFAPLVVAGDSSKTKPAASATEATLSQASTFLTGRQYSAGEGSAGFTSRSTSQHSQAAENRASEPDESVGVGTPKPEIQPPESELTAREVVQTEEPENDM